MDHVAQDYQTPAGNHAVRNFSRLSPAAGFKVRSGKGKAVTYRTGLSGTEKGGGNYQCPKFPTNQVEYLFPTATSNKIMAEYMQAQWKPNLGLTVTVRD